MMRAAVFEGAGGPEVIRIVEVPRPEPGPEEVLVRVQASGLNRADLLQRQGKYPAPPGSPQDIPGLEFAGIVEAVGDRVGELKVGQRVFGIAGGGGHAEYIVSHERLLAAVPENLDPVQAAAVPESFITAHDALFTQGGLRPGQRTLVHAAGGGVGTAVVQLAKAAGCFVIGTARSADKLRRAAGLGLDVGIDTSAEGFAPAVKAATGGRGADVCVDFIGAAALAGNLDALAPKGTLVLVGVMGGAVASVDLGKMLYKRLHVVGTTLRGRPLEEKALATQLFANQVLPQLERGLLRPVIDRVFPLDALAEAHRYMASNESFGKIVITL